VLPNEEEAFVKFKNYKKQLRVPFVIYADFECSTRQIEKAGADCKSSYTDKYQKHEPNSFSYYIVSDVPNYKSEIKLFRGENVAQNFVKSLLKEQDKIFKIMKKVNEKNGDCNNMIITPEQTIDFHAAKDCHICEKPLHDDRVRDHCHLTNQYRGAAHSKCNIEYNYAGFHISVVLHNLKGYDSHIIIQGLNAECEKVKCSIR